VLPASQRLTSPAEFREVVRRGRRGGGSLLVAHLLRRPAAPLGADARVGFVVSKAVGSAVTRNLVKRRLRHLCRDRVAALPAGTLLVLRALPPAAQASYAELAAELDRCLARVATAESVGGR
jgi:ribonuclease P protein component